MPIVKNEDGTLRYKSAEYWIPKPWVDLTDDEVKSIISNLLEDDPTPLLTLADVIQERLKEKNK